MAEYTLAAILFANKRVFQLNQFYRQHKENRAPWTREAPEVGNYNKTIGIVGASHVGRLVIDYLKPFDLRVLLYDPYVTPLAARELGATKVGLSELLSGSDVVSLHAPLLKDTQHMIGARELSLMRDHSTLINTARGRLIEQDALLAELGKGRLFAVLDTTDPEVLPPDSPFYQLPNVFLTPHIAGSLGDETQRLTDYIVAEVETIQHRSGAQASGATGTARQTGVESQVLPVSGPQDVTIPTAYPALPLKNVVVFPQIVQHLAVGRRKSMAALKHATEHAVDLITVAQRAADVENPELEDLHEIGTLVQIKRIESHDQGAQVIVQGARRVRIRSHTANDDCLMLEVEPNCRNCA